MSGRELYEFRHPDPNAEVEPKPLYDSFRVVYRNPQTPDLLLPEGTVAATLALLDMAQVKQVWAVANGYSYLVAQEVRMATRTTSQQDKIDAMKKAEKDSWRPTHNKQRCHDLAKEAEEAIRKNKQQQGGCK